MSWGYKILLFYLAFVMMIFALVWGSYQSQIHLVSRDYYEKELKYQEVIDGSKNYSLSDQKIRFHLQNESLVVELPKDDFSMEYQGLEIWLYHRSDSNLDIRLNLERTSKNTFIIPLESRHRGIYTLKVQWKNAKGVPFYFEKLLEL